MARPNVVERERKISQLREGSFARKVGRPIARKAGLPEGGFGGGGGATGGPGGLSGRSMGLMGECRAQLVWGWWGWWWRENWPARVLELGGSDGSSSFHRIKKKKTAEPHEGRLHHSMLLFQ